ncbi:hypothetical protein H4219_003116 [Mycoemilia scoparia]|uniref:Uncharacterized protein n=1 Tax=Mycoemilia scoparia TaxID=417184 RepID=A0A9W8DTV5_9FUNG|nr:hypothetical protein H4219_003116 [Mycoemilia scoparia]
MVKLYAISVALLAVAATPATATGSPYNDKPKVPEQQPAYVKPAPLSYGSAPYGISSDNDSQDCDWPVPSPSSSVPEPGYESQPAQISPPLPDNYSSADTCSPTTITTYVTVTATPSDCSEQQGPSPSQAPGSPYNSAPASIPPYVNKPSGDVYNDQPKNGAGGPAY